MLRQKEVDYYIRVAMKEGGLSAENIADILLHADCMKAKEEEILKTIPEIDTELYNRAFEMFTSMFPDIYGKGELRGKFMTVIRRKPSPCYLSGIVHDRDNGYITVDKRATGYEFKYGCNRGCKVNGLSKVRRFGAIKT